MVKNLSYTPGQLNKNYITFLLPHVGCRKAVVLKQLEAFLLGGGALAKYATKEVPRSALFRAAHRFSQLHLDVQAAAKLNAET